MVGIGTWAAGAGVTAGATWYANKAVAAHPAGTEDFIQDGFKPQAAYYPTVSTAAQNTSGAASDTAIEGPALERRGSLKQWWSDHLTQKPTTYKPRKEADPLWWTRQPERQAPGVTPASGIEDHTVPVFTGLSAIGRPAGKESGRAPEHLKDL